MSSLSQLYISQIPLIIEYVKNSNYIIKKIIDKYIFDPISDEDNEISSLYEKYNILIYTECALEGIQKLIERDIDVKKKYYHFINKLVIDVLNIINNISCYYRVNYYIRMQYPNMKDNQDWPIDITFHDWITFDIDDEDEIEITGLVDNMNIIQIK